MSKFQLLEEAWQPSREKFIIVIFQVLKKGAFLWDPWLLFLIYFFPKRMKFVWRSRFNAKDLFSAGILTLEFLDKFKIRFAIGVIENVDAWLEIYQSYVLTEISVSHRKHVRTDNILNDASLVWELWSLTLKYKVIPYMRSKLIDRSICALSCLLII